MAELETQPTQIMSSHPYYVLTHEYKFGPLNQLNTQGVGSVEVGTCKFETVVGHKPSQTAETRSRTRTCMYNGGAKLLAQLWPC